MENKTYIEEMIKKARAAQQAIEGYTQEQVDALVKAMGKVIFDNREVLSKEALEETGLGIYENKVAKHASITMSHWWYLRDQKSVGELENDPINKVVTFAKPIGVIACITPTTNPTTTAIGNGMHAVKSRNAVIVAPHPRAKKCTAHAVQLIDDAIVALGGPKDLVQAIDEPSIELTGYLMSKADVVVATGGSGMVKAAYSSGKPSYGVGQGNVQVIVDEDYTEFTRVAASSLGSRTYDNGMPCTGEQTIFLPRANKEKILDEFTKIGSFIVSDPKDVDKLRSTFFKEDGAINVDVVGKIATEVAAYAGIEVPEDTKLLMVELEAFGRDEILCREIMAPIIRFIAYDDFKDAVAMAKANLLYEGAGHTSVVYSTNDEHIHYAGDELPVSRVIINQIGNFAGGATPFNGLPPTISLGCGSWGNNSISENLTFKHLMNTTRVAYLLADAQPFDPETFWD